MVWPTNYIVFGGRNSVMMTMTLSGDLATEQPCLASGDKTICVQSFGALCNAGLGVSK